MTCPVCGNELGECLQRAFCRRCGLDVETKWIRFRMVRRDDVQEANLHINAMKQNAAARLEEIARLLTKE